MAGLESTRALTSRLQLPLTRAPRPQHGCRPYALRLTGAGRAGSPDAQAPRAATRAIRNAREDGWKPANRKRTLPGPRSYRQAQPPSMTCIPESSASWPVFKRHGGHKGHEGHQGHEGHKEHEGTRPTKSTTGTNGRHTCDSNFGTKPLPSGRDAWLAKPAAGRCAGFANENAQIRTRGALVCESDTPSTAGRWPAARRMCPRDKYLHG